MERYHDFDQPSSHGIDSDYTSIDDMERYHDSDYISANDNEAQVSSHASSHGTNFDNNDMVERHSYDYNSDDMVENIYDYHSSSMCDDIDYTFDNMQEEMNPITIVFKGSITF